MSDEHTLARTDECKECERKTLHWIIDGEQVCESCGTVQ